MQHPSQALMAQAIEFGYIHGTVGCLIVKDDEIIAISGGTIFSAEHDVTGHSEINAIRQACKKLGSHHLHGCWLYTTYEPCPMCMAAICWAKMAGVVYAATQEDRNDRWTMEVHLRAVEVIARAEHKPQLIEAFMRQESLKILEL
ncbi:MAG TPA: nucleoside deaminase [Anaerolineae bacterium]|nr:nucleoside deaminase [Anaerolineae bacterium]HQH37115.1 nucleoside deaminase [Anaerolineae bacterium]